MPGVPARDSRHEAPCPFCRHLIPIADFDVDRGEIFACSACGEELELLGFDPLRLVRAKPADEGEDT